MIKKLFSASEDLGGEEGKETNLCWVSNRGLVTYLHNLSWNLPSTIAMAFVLQIKNWEFQSSLFHVSELVSDKAGI